MHKISKSFLSNFPSRQQNKTPGAGVSCFELKVGLSTVRALVRCCSGGSAEGLDELRRFLPQALRQSDGLLIAEDQMWGKCFETKDNVIVLKYTFREY